MFLSKSIPIYDGAPDIGSFIQTDSYLTYDENIIKNINILNKNIHAYNKLVQSNKISNNYKKIDLTII